MEVLRDLRAKRKLILGFTYAVTLLIILFVWRTPRDSSDNVYEVTPAPPELIGSVRFKEVAIEKGVIYNHRRTPRDKILTENYALYFPTPSVSVVDINDDGYMDIYLPSTEPRLANLLYISEAGVHFTEAARQYGIEDERRDYSHAMGIFIDLDRDGYLDLIQSFWGPHTFFRGHGPGRPFTEEPDKFSGYDSRPDGFSVVDINRDGHLDLVFGNFLSGPNESRYMEMWMIARQNNKTGGSNHLLINDGKKLKPDPRFNFLTRSYTHSVGISDINLDGWPDIFFANDYSYDELFLNEKGESVRDVTDEYLPKRLHGHSGMNSDFGDFDGDGLIDLYVTNIHKPPFFRRYNLLWKKRPDGHFDSVSLDTGTARCGFSWSAKFADFNNDGEMDLAVANGRERSAGMRSPAEGKSLWYRRYIVGEIAEPLREVYFLKNESFAGTYVSAFERDCLFIQKNGKFFDVARSAGTADEQEGRGLALVDFNNDGKMDFVTVSVKGRLKLYENVSPAPGNWIGLRLKDKSGSTMPIGSFITLKRTEGHDMVYEYYIANGYNSQSDPRVHFGLGETRPSSVEVRWPDGQKEVFRGLVANQYQDIIQGKGL